MTAKIRLIDGSEIPMRVLSRENFSWVPESHKMGSTVYDEDGHWAAFTPGSRQNRNFSPVHLGAEEYFFLGDNRDNSLDCRAWGPVKENSILGKVVFTIRTGQRRKVS